MVSIKFIGVKGLAAASAGLFSLASCAPMSASHATSITEAVTDSTNVATTSTPPSAQTMTVSDNDMLQSLSPIPDSNVPGEAEETGELVHRVAGLFGVTTAQMVKVQLEKTDPELAEPANGVRPDEATSKLTNLTLLGGLGLEAEIGIDPATMMEEDYDERKNKMFMKRRQQKDKLMVGLVNGTPYTWKRIGLEFNDMHREITKTFRQVILPGEPFAVYARTLSEEAEAMVQYELEGTSEKTWFTLRISSGEPHQVTVEYGGALETVANGDEGKRGSVVDLNVDRGVSCATFYLTGSEGRFLSNDAPANWMHTMLEEIGNYTLLDVMLPRSHHAGMYTLNGGVGIGFGGRGNTWTQDFSVYDQLKVGGVRVIDSRLVLTRRRRQVFESHGSKIAGVFHGSLGVSHDSMINQINRFNDEYPGELIIIDVDGHEMRDNKKFNQLSSAGVAHVVESFKRLKHRAVLVPGEDIAQIPINRFIGDGKSAVIIRMEEYRIRGLPKGYPGATEGFITNNELPYHKHWSNMDNADRMLKDQTEKLLEYKDGRFRQLYVSDFLLTQKGIAVLFGTPIRVMNEEAWKKLIEAFWGVFRKDVFPNWLAMDAIRGGELRGIAMTVNECLVAKRCGKLGNRAPDAKDIKLADTTTSANATTTESAHHDN
ncbi:LysM domain-containing protein [Beauveria brongniartii RCEF 3172]|uniref:LysM domain-containing protein n=1 Tax=Beauveria brongniartii RCEF 3172 TaxID=1081107 RepID=A0A166ZJB5_9HYPO|nr:LysM domain-containing protein [Beauveria brongniartii RCEF 3172]